MTADIRNINFEIINLTIVLLMRNKYCKICRYGKVFTKEFSKLTEF